MLMDAPVSMMPLHFTVFFRVGRHAYVQNRGRSPAVKPFVVGYKFHS